MLFPETNKADKSNGTVSDMLDTNILLKTADIEFAEIYLEQNKRVRDLPNPIIIPMKVKKNKNILESINSLFNNKNPEIL